MITAILKPINCHILYGKNNAASLQYVQLRDDKTSKSLWQYGYRLTVLDGLFKEGYGKMVENLFQSSPLLKWVKPEP